MNQCTMVCHICHNWTLNCRLYNGPWDLQGNISKHFLKLLFRDWNIPLKSAKRQLLFERPNFPNTRFKIVSRVYDWVFRTYKRTKRFQSKEIRFLHKKSTNRARKRKSLYIATTIYRYFTPVKHSWHFF